MKFHSEKEISEFLSAVDKCTGDVYLKSVRGDCYNLKSELSKYVAIAALLRDESEQLELFCDKHEDEKLFFEFFIKNSGVLK